MHNGEHCNFTVNMAYAWVSLDLSLKHRLRCTAYAIRSDAHSSQKLRHWELQGSACGEEWEMLRRHVNDETLECRRFSVGSWSVSPSDAYRYFRIVQTGPNSSKRNNIMIHGWELYGDLEVYAIPQEIIQHGEAIKGRTL